MSNPGSAKKEPIWVRDVGGQPRVRWGRVAGFIASVATVTMLGALVQAFTDVPFSLAAVLAPQCVTLAYLVVAIDWQRQRVRYGNWRFRIRLSALFILTAIAGLYFAVVVHGVRENERGFQVNKELTAELEAVVRGGLVSIGGTYGQQITCQVTRPNFSDDDLARLIELASGRGTCELSALILGKTAVTNEGIQRLAACEKLTVLELPALRLDEPSFDALTKCRRLELLFLDERQATTAQVARLRRALPKVRLNGKTWTERDTL